MRIRPAAGADFDEVTALLEELGRAEVTAATRRHALELYERQLEDPDAAHLVAEAGGQAVGFCSLHFRGRLNHVRRQAWVPDLIVTERARQAGVGRALLEEAERVSREHGCGELVLESGYQRAEAHHLYRQAGMRDAGKYFRKTLP